MRYQDLNMYWKRIFELEWASLCEGSKAIAALIVSEDGTIISEGRNKIGETEIPNSRVSHAEVEAIRNLDVRKYPFVKSYTLYAAQELISEGIFAERAPSSYNVEEIFDRLMAIIEREA